MSEKTASHESGYAFASARSSEQLEKVAPFIVFLGKIINFVGPYVVKLWAFAMTIWVALQPYHPEEFLPLFFGLFVTFFGGHYFTLLAAVEAYRLCGYQQTKNCLLDLYENYIKVREENEKDDLVDDDHDGIPDVQQITSKQLVTRKLSLAFKSMDPLKVSSALSGIWMGFLGVVAVLRVKFAQTIALGATVGHIFESGAEYFIRPILEKMIPTDYQKWIPVIIAYGCKVIGVSVAWTIQRAISAFYSAVRGSQMFVSTLFVYLARNGYPSLNDGSPLFTAVTGLLAWIGFAWQLKSGFRLPFPLNVIMFPLTVVEWFVMWMVAVETA